MPGSGTNLWGFVDCIGTETSIANCVRYRYPTDVHLCNRSQEMSLSCGTSPEGLQFGKHINLQHCRLSDSQNIFTHSVSVVFMTVAHTRADRARR